MSQDLGWGKLKSELRALGVPLSDDPLDLRAVSVDLWPRKLLELRSRGPAPATVDCLVWPESTAQLAELVRWCVGKPIALYPYGAGSGVCGAVIAEDGTAAGPERMRLVVDLKRMRAVRSIDRVSQTAWVEAGIIGENLERHLNQEGLMLGHFPSSIYCSSLGGYLATRSAGQLSTKYGKIEDLVLAVEMVLPDGTVAEFGRAPRSAMGVDWTQLFLGSEGTLGFFTAARLQIRTLPEERVFQSFEAPSVTAAMEFARKLSQSDARPAVLRIYDEKETALALNSQALREAGFSSGCAVIVIFEGNRRIARAQAEECLEFARAAEMRVISESLAQHWWEHRYAVSYKQQLILSHDRMLLDTFELAATWDRLGEVYQAVRKVPVGMGVILAHFSHFYPTGANIYFTWVSHAGWRGDPVEKYDAIWEQLLSAALGAGATLSHHHGVGIQKREFLKVEKKAGYPLWRKIKSVIDPEDRFNPGKVGG